MNDRFLSDNIFADRHQITAVQFPVGYYVNFSYEGV